jgi:transcriptional regulator with PAS, ATPase and Fis domain
VKALEGGAVRQIPEQAGSDRLVGGDRLGAENADDAEWQEQSEELSIRKNTGELIEKALEKHGGNVKAAAAELGISERTVEHQVSKALRILRGKSQDFFRLVLLTLSA